MKLRLDNTDPEYPKLMAMSDKGAEIQIMLFNVKDGVILNGNMFSNNLGLPYDKYGAVKIHNVSKMVEKDKEKANKKLRNEKRKNKLAKWLLRRLL